MNINKKVVLFIAKGSNDSGNYQTISRINNNIKKLNPKIEIFFIRIISYETNLEKEYIEKINRINPDVIIGLNLFRCLFLDTIITNARMVVILGGTDINSSLNEEINLLSVSLIRKCQQIIAFSLEMKLKFKSIYSKFPEICNKKIDIIPQGINIPDSILYKNNEFNEDLLKTWKIQHFFLVVGRLRSVKDPGYIVEPFIEWSSITGNEKYSLLYVGSVEEKTQDIILFLKQIKKCQNIFHVESLPQNQVFNLLHKCTALINCSKNEGQSTSILEAMSIGAPVIARNVPGNIGLIENGNNGLLFNCEKDFIEGLTKIIDDKVSKTLVENAKIYVNKNHNSHSEAAQYIKIINDSELEN